MGAAGRRGGEGAPDGDRFDGLFREYGDLIYRYCLRRTGDPERAEDVRSAVFLEAWRRRHEVDFRSRAPLPWLYGVAANVLRNERRALRRRDAAQIRLPAPVIQFESVEDVTDRVDASMRARIAMELIERLPTEEREVVVLCLAQDLTYAAAAIALDVPVGTIRSRLSRARMRLGALAGRSNG